MLLLFALALAALPAHAAAAPTLQVATKAEWATGSSVDISWTPVHHATNSTVFLVQASSSTTALNATSTIQIGRSTIGTLQYSVSECVQNGADYYVVVNDENGARGVSSRVTVLAALPKGICAHSMVHSLRWFNASCAVLSPCCEWHQTLFRSVITGLCIPLGCV